MASFKKDKLVLVIGQGGANPGFTQAFENDMVTLLSSKNATAFTTAVASAAQSNPL